MMRPGDADWPTALENITDPPSLIWVTGDPAILSLPSIGIVGTRRATARGLALARGLAHALATRGWCVVSGLARGIDSAAHRGALEAGGRTVAVMASGIDRTYPREHLRLRRDIETAGACLTEFDTGDPPRRSHFPQRNRLIAGLCMGVIVVEAPWRSGALNTAHHAVDGGREVFAMPGPVDLATSKGCHRLLREGALLLEDARDVDEVLGLPETGPPTGGAVDTIAEPGAGSAARWILDRLDLEGISRDELHGRWPGTEEVWCGGLLDLELAGLIRRLPGGRLARTIWRS